MWYFLGKHKMLKMSTRDLFAEVFSGGKKAEYFERLRWECPLRYEEGLSNFAEHFEKVVCGIWKADVTCEDYRQALSNEIWLSKLRKRKRCLFGFRTSNPVGDLSLEIRRTVPLRFLRKQSCSESGSRDSESGVSSLFEKVIMLGVWLSRFGGRCLFDLEASNLVESVFSNRCNGSCKLHVSKVCQRFLAKLSVVPVS
ncbi:hypothetical protein FF1_001210 [Malus domestica]